MLLCASSEAGCLGYIGAYLLPDGAEIMTVAVDAAARGRGIGKKLVLAALRTLQDHGVPAVHLEVRAGNAAAGAVRGVRFYFLRRAARLLQKAARGRGALPVRLSGRIKFHVTLPVRFLDGCKEKRMYILGIESSCDETSAAVVEMDGGVRRIRSNIVASQIDVHRLYGGVVPEIAGRAHIEAISGVTARALEEAGIPLADVGLVAVTSHPGLIGALLVGVNFAKSLAFANHIPLCGVDHVHAHIAAAYLAHPNLVPPFLGVVLSGGHTSFYLVRDYTDFEEVGSTRDDAAGEAFDKIGRVIGLPYPGGAALDALAHTGNADAYRLPSPALAGDTLDFSFSGLKTAALNLLHTAEQKGRLSAGRILPRPLPKR